MAEPLKMKPPAATVDDLKGMEDQLTALLADMKESLLREIQGLREEIKAAIDRSSIEIPKPSKDPKLNPLDFDDQ